MNKTSLYLAHPWHDRKMVKELQPKIELELQIDLLNPFYEIERSDVVLIEELDKRELSPQEDRDVRQKQIAREPERYKKIVENDLNAIQNTDGILAFVTGSKSIGTFMEICLGNTVYKKPVYIVCLDSESLQHPWILYFGTKVFPSVDDFMAWWKTNNIEMQRANIKKRVEEIMAQRKESERKKQEEWDKNTPEWIKQVLNAHRTQPSLLRDSEAIQYD